MAIRFPWHLDPVVDVVAWDAWWAEEREWEHWSTSRYRLLTLDGLTVDLVLAPRAVERFVERVEAAPVEAPPAKAKPKAPKKVAARSEAAVAARDDLALKEKPQDETEFALTNPTEQDLKGRRRN